MTAGWFFLLFHYDPLPPRITHYRIGHKLTLPWGYDIIRIDDGVMEGFSLVNPEGEIFHEVRIAIEHSPGWIALLQEAEQLIEEGSARRHVLEHEQSIYRAESTG